MQHDVARHRHPELEDRITGEITGMHTDLVELRGEMRRGFADMAQLFAQVLARLPEDPGDE
jgi:hypothetical protein